MSGTLSQEAAEALTAARRTTPAEPPKSEQEPTWPASQRPEGLPENFKSVTALVESYKRAQAKITQQAQALAELEQAGLASQSEPGLPDGLEALAGPFVGAVAVVVREELAAALRLHVRVAALEHAGVGEAAAIAAEWADGWPDEQKWDEQAEPEPRRPWWVRILKPKETIE